MEIKDISKKTKIVTITGAALFIILALIFTYGIKSPFTTILSGPFQLVALILAAIIKLNSTVGWIFYVLVCLTPLIPFIIAIKKIGKFTAKHLLWILLVCYTFFMMFFFIKPELLINQSTTWMINTHKYYYLIAMPYGWFGILLLIGITNIIKLIKTKDEKVFIFTGIILLAFSAYLMLNIIFQTAVILISHLWNLFVKFEFALMLTVFASLIAYFISIIPTAILIRLLLLSNSLIKDMKKEFFSTLHLFKLEKLIAESVRLVLATIICFIVNLLLSFLFMKSSLMVVTFELGTIITNLLISCIVVIFAKIIIKGIELNEERKLVI